MFLCEDDRYELDMLIEHTLSTIRCIRTQLDVIAALKVCVLIRVSLYVCPYMCP